MSKKNKSKNLYFISL